MFNTRVNTFLHSTFTLIHHGHYHFIFSAQAMFNKVKVKTIEMKQKNFVPTMLNDGLGGCYVNVWVKRVRLTLMMNAAIFFPLYSAILHWLAAGSVEVKAGGESDLKLKHNYTPSLGKGYSRQNLIPSHINITLGDKTH